jgi:type I restriction enzyme, S subunit
LLECQRCRDASKALQVEAENILLRELDLDTLNLSHKLTYERSFNEVAKVGRYDAQYFHPRYSQIINCLPGIAPIEKIGQWGKVLKGRSINQYIDGGVPVIRSGNLIDLDELSDMKFAGASEELFYLQVGDICISSIGFGSIGKVQVFDRTDDLYATVSEVTVIRQNRVNPYYLQVFLQSRAGQFQIEQRITGATGQLHLYPRDVESIVVPILPRDKQDFFEQMIMKSRQIKKEAARLLDEAKRRVEKLILDGSYL